jgi:hypothetical protein
MFAPHTFSKTCFSLTLRVLVVLSPLSQSVLGTAPNSALAALPAA